MTYLRYPHIHADLITFTADDDVWLVGAAGGRAWRLTSDHARVRSPRISPDCAHVAFVSFATGQPELMVAEVATGVLRRLTWLGSSAMTMLGWADETHVLVGANAGEFEVRNHVVRSVGLDGSVARLRLGRASGLARHHAGVTALSTPFSRPPAHWKRYRGGTAPRLWIDRAGDADGTGAKWQRLLRDDAASLTDPLWVGDSLVFTSDRAATFPHHASEQANLWIIDGLATTASATADGAGGHGTGGAGEPRQLTHQAEADGYVRDATTDGTRIVWHSRGEIKILDSLDAQVRTLSVTLPGTQVQPLRLDPSTGINRISPDQGGNASVIEWRGKTFWLAHREGPARALCADSSIRTREPVVLGSTGLAAYVTDVDGEDAIEVASVTREKPPRRIGAGALGRVLDLRADPAGKTLATISHDGSIRLIEVGNGRTRLVGHSGFGEARTPRFSPDGKYLVWSQPTQGEEQLAQLMIVEVKSDRDAQPLTSGKFNDASPAFTRDGKYVAFLSDRTFDPAYNQHSFDLSFNGVTRPWLLPLAADEPAPFGPSASGWAIGEVVEESKSERGRGEKPVTTAEVELEGAEERILPFPVASGVFEHLESADGGLLWMRTGDAEDGELGTKRAGDAGEKPKQAVQFFDFAKRKLVTVVDAADEYEVTGDGKLIVVRTDGDISVVPANRKVEADDDAFVSVDTSRLRFELDRRAEWLQMFEENARIMRDHYWREDMNGVDWESVTLRWRAVAAKALTHDDLVDILWETVGELNTSHAYVTPPSGPGNGSDDSSTKLGFLGADLERAAGGWTITRILPGESSEPAARSPLRQAGVAAAVGDVIVAVNGQPVDEVAGPAAHLQGAADSIVELTLRRGRRRDRTVAVIPLASEEKLRYQDWVRSRREYVAEKSQGRVGYVHVPDMMSNGWAQLHRDLRQAMGCEGVIADVRFNRGGHTSALVAERFADRVIAWNAARNYDAMVPDPEDARRGPVAFVANEFSGSDGDIINARVQAKGIGPVIGVRTWGGVVGIDGRYDLVDGTGVTQPRYAFWLEGKEWGVENHGVDPDIEVEHDPGQLFADDDPQLDRAIAEVLDRLEARPAAAPPEFPPPRVQSPKKDGPAEGADA
ncbi:S41 family peptidase [Brevibacterium oceani]|uniref:S41 family peptidase n=1 Tax=Brevibacterium oceani TaxID=358099 RepID=UPI002810F836|nr:PDZ domain-containing protein [Brevibacterium oceani]